MNGVRYFRNIIFALAASFWLPASAHCHLETIPGLEFLRCTADGQSSKGDCKDNGCCSVEKSQYKSEQQGASLQLPAFPLFPARHFLPVRLPSLRN
jgi:hypothetical protein